MNKFNTVKRLALIIIGLNSGLSVKGMDVLNNKQGEIFDTVGMETHQLTVPNQGNFLNYRLLNGLKKSGDYSKFNVNIDAIQNIKANKNEDIDEKLSILSNESVRVFNLLDLPSGDKDSGQGLIRLGSENLSDPLASCQTVKTVDLAPDLWENKKVGQG